EHVRTQDIVALIRWKIRDWVITTAWRFRSTSGLAKDFKPWLPTRGHTRLTSIKAMQATTSFSAPGRPVMRTVTLLPREVPRPATPAIELESALSGHQPSLTTTALWHATSLTTGSLAKSLRCNQRNR